MGTYAVTGATGSLGTVLTKYLLKQGHKVRALARGEAGHQRLMTQIPKQHAENYSPFIGDVRDRDRLERAFESAEFIVHAAAMKVIPLCEYNPLDSIKTNVLGTMNVIDVCLDRKIKRAVVLSTDKACSPCTAYGAQKLAAERAWLASNKYCGDSPGIFTAVRYGNVFASAGSILHTFINQAQRGEVTITDERCTRFHLRLDYAVKLVLMALHDLNPGELLVPKLAAYRVKDFAYAIAPKAEVKLIGLRASEKLHESMINENESPYAEELPDWFILNFQKPPTGKRFEYSSGNPQGKMKWEDIKLEYDAWRKENPA